ncbi:BolA family protein [Thauera mechernichensis]|uniref:BolA family protein n=1 Tax=Thauera mechernichensis TaxID=82788 RepID=A0ABW3WBZ1_9RHOO|nr:MULTISPECIES: BolA family protein [Thauera]ENO82157.1 BolA family protein [Thauera sp. 27]ENO92554.1 BolA family protein [Thauera sp. 28]MDG3065334.1 BolA family transcriptional regulator [Thauera mechernichensis]WBL62588.1 BolA family transcriptional regulator [Thauera sp. WB-2]HAG74218.1 BolA family transcriptional regulator [Thauera sp.]
MSAQTVERMRAILAQGFQTRVLEIEDESALHAGHAGAREGGGHYRLYIVSDAFEGCSRVQRQRMIYTALGDMMKKDIHALAIRALSATEATTHEN